MRVCTYAHMHIREYYYNTNALNCQGVGCVKALNMSRLCATFRISGYVFACGDSFIRTNYLKMLWGKKIVFIQFGHDSIPSFFN